jgi:hypothetical protein
VPAKKYGWRHQQARERVKRQVNAGLATCARCGKPIIPGTSWDLGHSDTDPTRYHGAEHRRCNRGHRPAKQRQPAAPWLSGDNQIGGRRPQSRDWGGGCIPNPDAE